MELWHPDFCAVIIHKIFNNAIDVFRMMMKPVITELIFNKKKDYGKAGDSQYKAKGLDHCKSSVSGEAPEYDEKIIFEHTELIYVFIFFCCAYNSRSEKK